MDDLRDQVKASTEKVIAVVRPGGPDARGLKENLEKFVAAADPQSEEFQEAARYLYDMATHPRCLQDRFIQGLPSNDWYAMLEAMAIPLRIILGKKS